MEITESKVHYVIYEDSIYTRHSANDWTIAMGEINEPVYEFSEIEADFQRALEEKQASEPHTKALPLHGVMPELPIEKIIGLSEAWPLLNVLEKLTEATEILLHDKGYDKHGWEGVSICVGRAKDIAELLKGN